MSVAICSAAMNLPTKRMTVDLTAYPDLVVIYLGMIVSVPLSGMETLTYFGPAIYQAVGGSPDGLLLHEDITYSQDPLHVGMRQYWRDFDSLERFARSEPHREWWAKFIRDSGGTGFWHETYFMKGGMESIYTDVGDPIGMLKFAPVIPARGAMFNARRRLNLPGDETMAAPLTEAEVEALV